MALKVPFMPLTRPGACALSCSWMPLSSRKKMPNFSIRNIRSNIARKVSRCGKLYIPHRMSTPPWNFSLAWLTMAQHPSWCAYSVQRCWPYLRQCRRDAWNQGNGKTTMVDSPAISAVHRPILRDPQSMPECDYPSANQRMAIWSMNQIQRMDRFLHVIRKTCIEQRGKLIIPASVSAERRKSFAARPGEYR